MFLLSCSLTHVLNNLVKKVILCDRQGVVLSWLLVATRLFLVAMVMWWGVMLSDQYVQQCSRRLANLTFVLWMVRT